MSMPSIDPGSGTVNQALADVIESIALQEAGLSHIINAEGEILQHFIEPSVRRFTPEDLCCVNNCIGELLDSISAIEQSLNAKLQTAIGAL